MVIVVIITHEVSKASYRQTTGASHKLQQPHPLLIVHLLYELQGKVAKNKQDPRLIIIRKNMYMNVNYYVFS